jgi:uncharacterized membrane protein HdeD (DUF308 family)
VRTRIERTPAAVAPTALAASGAAAVVFAVLVMAWPELTADTLLVLFGVYALGHGLLKLVVGVIRPRGAPRTSLVADALLTLGAGIVVLAWPLSSRALFFVIGLTMIGAGLAGVAAASTLDLSARERTILGAAAVASVVLGIVVVWPGGTLDALRWLVAAQALVLGFVLLAAALRMRARPVHS